MKLDFKLIKAPCRRDAIFAYVDKELSAAEERELELHLKECEACSIELNAQKKVSNSLEIVLDDEMSKIEIPENFSKVVTARAQNNFQGLRKKREISRSVFLVSALVALLVATGVGLSSIFTFSGAGENGENLSDGVFTHALFDGVSGIGDIVRSLGRKYVFGSIFSSIILSVLLVATILVLTKLLMRDSRS